jgi:hypothetical protein
MGSQFGSGEWIKKTGRLPRPLKKNREKKLYIWAPDFSI